MVGSEVRSGERSVVATAERIESRKASVLLSWWSSDWSFGAMFAVMESMSSVRLIGVGPVVEDGRLSRTERTVLRMLAVLGGGGAGPVGALAGGAGGS